MMVLERTRLTTANAQKENRLNLRQRDQNKETKETYTNPQRGNVTLAR